SSPVGPFGNCGCVRDVKQRSSVSASSSSSRLTRQVLLPLPFTPDFHCHATGAGDRHRPPLARPPEVMIHVVLVHRSLLCRDRIAQIRRCHLSTVGSLRPRLIVLRRF